MNGQNEADGPARLLRGLLHSRSPVASIGIAVAAILLAAVGGSAWWATRVQDDALRRARADQICTLGEVLAQSAEVMMAGDDLSALRRIVAESAQTYRLTDCRIVLPDGRIVADARASRITPGPLPAEWAGMLDASGAHSTDDRVARTIPVLVAGRGNARLEIAGSTRPPGSSTWLTEAGIGAISIAALLALLALHRLIRARVDEMCAIRQALLDHAGGQTSVSALEVDPRWGPEARAWNAFLDETRQQQRRLTEERTRRSLAIHGCANAPLDAACDALSQGLILVGEDLRATYANGAAAVLLGVTRQEVFDADDVTKFFDDERVAEAVRAAAKGPLEKRVIVEAERTGEAGGGVLRFIVRPVRRQDSGVSMVIVEDVTQQRVAEESRNAFVAQATHELRTPLTNIRIYAETALDEGANAPSVRAKAMNVINQEVRRLDRMVGDILSVAEIEAGTFKLRADDVRLDELLADLKDDYQASAEDKGIELAFDLPPKLPVLQGDRDKVALALHNLLGNALKYTPPGGKVVLSARVEDGRLVVDVTDTGIGIAGEDQEHIFEKFYRAKDSRVAEVTGSGLGLAIAREVIRLHGGDIQVRSELDQGSTFTLTLPAVAEAA